MRLFFFIILIFSSLLHASFDIRQILPSESVEDAIDKRNTKKNVLLKKWARVKLDRFPFYKNEDKGLASLSGAIARILLGKDIESVNGYLLDKRFQPGLPGTRINILGVCQRKGDYDFVLQELIRVAYLGENVISKQAYERVVGELLNQKGNKKYITFRICFKKIKDTENHILMTEAARYLTNQIIYKRTGEEIYNNSSNGFNKWLVKHLEHFLAKGLDEINSKPYAGYTISTLLNLFDFSDNEQVRETAKAVLDYLSMKYAMESIGNRRYPTFRRQYKHYNHQSLDHADALNAMMMYWVGNYHYLMNENINLNTKILPYGDRFALNASLSSYSPHESIMKHFFSKDVSLHVYEHNMRGMQIVYKEQDYIISAGGVHRKVWPAISMVNDVLAAPTILIPRLKGRKLDQMFYFLGTNKQNKRSNLCVGKNFMCGVNLHIPELSPDCVEREGNWSFYNFRKPQCHNSIYSGLVIATYSRNVKDRRFNNFGLLEVAKQDMGYQQFKRRVLKYNREEMKYKKTNIYTKSTLETIKFKFHTRKGAYPIKGGLVYGNDRVRGTHHFVNKNRMLIYSPDGELVEYFYNL